MTLMERLLEAGYPESEIHHWRSDMYIRVTPMTTRIVEEYYKEHGWSRAHHAPIFRDAVTGKPMYDCAFEYTPYYADKDKIC